MKHLLKSLIESIALTIVVYLATKREIYCFFATTNQTAFAIEIEYAMSRERAILLKTSLQTHHL
jgi:hypothetical protein